VTLRSVLRPALHKLRRGARLGSRIPARIRDKLAWWFLATLTLQIIVYALVVFFLMQRSLTSQVDRLLDMDVRAITEALASQHTGSGRPTGAGLVEGLGTGLLGSDAQAVLWFQAEDATPHALAATPGAPTLPAPDFFETQRRSLVTAADGEDFYLRSIEVVGDGGARYLVQAARPAALVSEPLSQLAWMLSLGLASVMLLGWLGGRAIAGAALAPIQEIVRATRAIRLSRLSKRLRESGPNDELRELTQVINDLLQRFQDGLDRERRFASDVSHELRTPLAAQIVIAQAALRNTTAGPREYETAVQHMLEEARHMEQFIERLLSLTRIATQPLAMSMEPVDVHDAVHQTAATLQLLSDEKRHTLRVECAPGLQALGEATMLRQALMNVVHNAIDHCAPGARIVIRAALRQGKVVVEVDDNGPGVASQARTRLFTRFYRGQLGNQGKRGLGLGLSIVKALMEAQGGSIHLEPKEEPGARFCLTLQLPPKKALQSPSPSILDAMESVPVRDGEGQPSRTEVQAEAAASAATDRLPPPPTRKARPQWARSRTS
jgi:signal transduction histidine kinase